MSSGNSNPSLLGILLVVQTRTGTGAQVLFHYPPDPLSDDESNLPSDPDQTNAVDASSSSESDSESSSDDNLNVPAASAVSGVGDGSVEDRDDQASSRLSKVRSNEDWTPSWEPLLGIGEEGLVSLLAPGRVWHKRRFELGINDLILLGRPVYARESGAWTRRRRRRRRNRGKQGLENLDENAAEASEASSEDNLERADVEHHDEADPTPDSTGGKSQLTMFHVVFVMNPPVLEHHLRVKDMYDNVVRKFSKVLKHEQASHDYVWRQTDIIQNIKAIHSHNQSSTQALYAELLKQSPLAAAIATTYRAISTSRVAAVALSPEVSLSLQIPPVTSTSYLPSLSEPPLQPGMWLTTANDTHNTTSDLDTATTASTNQLAKSFTLLLREPKAKILKDVQMAGGDIAEPLATFISKLRPSKSFYKLSQLMHLSLADIQLLSRHLIYWRRAIAIPPLHHRDTYIISPNADLSALSSAADSFATTFPMLPPLPRLLSLLSGQPVPFGTLIPSSDHKEEYYRVLGWLMRGGWITQLRSHAYIRVSSATKRAVRDHVHAEKLAATQSSLERIDLHPRHKPAAGAPRNSNNQLSSSATTAAALANQQLSSSTASSLSAHSHAMSRSHSQSHRPSLLSRPSSDTSASRAHPAQAHNPLHSSLVLSPLRATPLEASWLAQIHASLAPQLEGDVRGSSAADVAAKELWDTSLTEEDKAALYAAWPILAKYFNGVEPLEGIAVREGMKRKVVWELLGKAGLKWGWETGIVDDEGRRRGLLVSVRHW
jgi:nitrogen permease regulator 3-like protein